MYLLQVDGRGDRIEGFEDVICRVAHFLFPRNLWQRVHAVIQQTILTPNLEQVLTLYTNMECKWKDIRMHSILV